MMTRRSKIVLVMAAAMAWAGMPRAARAQQIPTPAQAQQALADPAVVAQLRQQLLNSGLSADQVRSRLTAMGYPASMLDAVLPGGGADSTFALTPDVYAAVKQLGVMDTTALDSLRLVGQRRQQTRARSDSALLDSIARALRTDTAAAGSLRALLAARAADSAVVDSGFTLFGLNMFSRATSQFDPNQNGPVSDDYQVGPGDRLVLTLTGDVQAAYALTVTREGWIVIPNVGQIPVANLTMTQLNNLLFARLSRSYSGIKRTDPTTHFTVSVAGLGTRQVYVTGDVKQPGAYQVSNLGTMLTALYAAGGPTDNGSMRGVQLVRGGKPVDTLDVYDYLLAGNAAKDVRLQSGDIVFVPVRGGRVRIAGGVMRPATYELKPSETLADALRMAGGFRATADRRSIVIERVVPPAERTASGKDRTMIQVTSPLLSSGLGPAVALQPGDIVRVGEIAKRVADRISVSGNVWQPGDLAFTPGMRLSQALRAAGGLKPDSYLGQVSVLRLMPDSTRRVVQASLKDTLGTPAQDILLRDGDSIQVYSLTEFRPKRFISIDGAVTKSGRFPYHDGMTLRDAVLLAGGLQDGALLTDAEIAHLPEDRANGVTAVTQRVPLDSTYLFERTADGRYLGPPGIAAPAATAPEVPLQPYDNVLIMRQPGWALQRTVAVEGEVRYPGVYALQTKDERLADVIERAGGLTNSAYAGGMVLVRHNGVGRIGVDLPNALARPSSRDNLPLVDGDSINVPTYSGIVSVRGAVNSPVAVTYVRGADLDYYVRAAGGGTAMADAGHAFVTQANGKIESKNSHLWIFRSTPTPGPGSTVFVPTKEPGSGFQFAQVISVTTSVLGTLVAMAALLRK
ncbi:MAG TPA: SLBB domain-containing protein [Gemmatimonadaceae bacterium]|nr:SLBB domain-containing protein [Gemmatimonadaceae bacterium]